MKEFPAWTIDTLEGEPRLVRHYAFPDFNTALEFTNRVGEIAEDANHHPVITLTWGKVNLRWWTHELSGLHRNDYFMAAQSDAAYEKIVG